MAFEANLNHNILYFAHYCFQQVNNYITNKILSTFLLLQLLFVGFISRRPEWIEKYYSNGIYPIISTFFRRLLGWIPISIGDILYLLLILIILRWIWLLIQTHMSPLIEHLYRLGAFISVIFFAFHLLWGFNYYRVPLQQNLGITSLEYTQEELIATTQQHIDKLNEIHHVLVINDSLAVEIPYKRREIYRMSSTTYKHLLIDSIDFSFKRKSIKNSLLSTPLSYMGFSGYLNPFTGESQVNKKIPKTIFPLTTCHEMAHQLGYASEGETNYIGYLACADNVDMYFRFSGELTAVQHLLYSLAQIDKEMYKTYFGKLNIGMQKNIQKNHDFWDSYQTPLEPFFKRFYDAYLKANRQEEGIQSYNEMVGYLVNSK